MNINELLSHIPEVENLISNDISKKLKLKKKSVQVSMSFNFELKMNVDLDCIDETDMKKKIEGIIYNAKDKTKICLEKEIQYGDDFILVDEWSEMIDRNVKYELDYVEDRKERLTFIDNELKDKRFSQDYKNRIEGNT